MAKRFSETIRKRVAQVTVNAVAGFLEDGSVKRGKSVSDEDFGYVVERIHNQVQGDDALTKAGFMDESEEEMYLVDMTSDGIIALAEDAGWKTPEQRDKFLAKWSKLADLSPILP